MKRFAPAALFAVCVAILSMAPIVGCGGDNPVDSEDDNPTWPGLPEITSLDYEAPAVTDGVITGVSSLEHFEPKVDSGLLFCRLYQEQMLNNSYSIQCVPGYYTLVESGQIVRQPELELVASHSSLGSFNVVKQWSPPRFRYVGSFGGHYYYLTDQQIGDRQLMYANEANICWAGGQILTIETAEENAFVTEVIQQEIPGVSLWLHLNDYNSEGEFKWFNGNAANYTNWWTDEPDGGVGENLVKLLNCDHPSHPGKWADVDNEFWYAMMESPDSLVLDSDSTLTYSPTSTYPYYPYNRVLFSLRPSGFVALDEIPSIRRVRYYRKLGEGKVSVGSFVEQGYSLTSGVDTTIAVSTARTITGTVSTKFNIIKAELSKSLTKTFSNSITVSRDSTKSVNIRVNGVEGKQRVFVIWQMCERYEIVDAGGNVWTDSNFAVNLITLDNGLDGYVVQTRDF